LNVVENGTSVNEEVEIDVDEQTEVIRVPKHDDFDAIELLNDFIAVRDRSLFTGGGKATKLRKSLAKKL